MLADVQTVLAFGVRHNARMGELEKRLARDGTPVARGSWQWLSADEDTVDWAHRQCELGPLDELALLWAPFSVYAGLSTDSRFREPAKLGLSPDAWGKADRSSATFALLCLAGMTELNRDAKARLAPDWESRFREAAKAAPPELAGGGSDTAGCAAKLDEWAALSRWARATEGGQDLVRLPKYHFQALTPATASDLQEKKGLGPLGEEAIRLCLWPDKPSPAWRARYLEKMEFIEACAAAASGRPRHEGWVPALEALLDFACRSEPFASPYEAEFDGRQVRFMQARKGLSPAEVRNMGAAERAAAEGLLRRGFVLQRVIGSDGRPVVQWGGYLGYIDLLSPPAKR